MCVCVRGVCERVCVRGVRELCVRGVCEGYVSERCVCVCEGVYEGCDGCVRGV